MNKWQQWYDSLPEHTKNYLDNQAIWKDSDMAKIAVVAFFLGFMFCLLMTGHI
jgi:hypothetical protein